jgi:hypothetical protein
MSQSMRDGFVRDDATGALVLSAAGTIGAINVKADYQAKGDAKIVSDAAITSGQSTVTSVSAAFTSADVGKVIWIAGAGAAGAQLSGTILSVAAGVATISVAASTTVAAATAEYGTDDSAAITSAVNAFKVAGGMLFFPQGNYICSGGYDVSTVSGVICGSGIGAAGFSTVLTLKPGSNASMFTIGKLTTLRDLGLDGNSQGQTGTSNGVVVNNAYVRLTNLFINAFKTDGIQLTGANAVGLHARDIEIRLCQGNGINIGASCFDNDYDSVNVGQSGLNGVLVGAANNCFTELHSWGNGTLASGNNTCGLFLASGIAHGRYTNCNFETNAGDGIRLNSTNRGLTFVGCETWKNNGRGAYGFQAKNISWTGCSFYDNGQNPTGTGQGQAGLVNDTGSSWSITGCTFFDDQGTKTQSFGYFELTADFTTIIGNSIRAAELKTGSTTITGVNNVPPAASIATFNLVA